MAFNQCQLRPTSVSIRKLGDLGFHHFPWSTFQYFEAMQLNWKFENCEVERSIETIFSSMINQVNLFAKLKCKTRL